MRKRLGIDWKEDLARRGQQFFFHFMDSIAAEGDSILQLKNPNGKSIFVEVPVILSAGADITAAFAALSAIIDGDAIEDPPFNTAPAKSVTSPLTMLESPTISEDDITMVMEELPAVANAEAYPGIYLDPDANYIISAENGNESEEQDVSILVIYYLLDDE